MGEGRCWHCGIPVEHAAKILAVIDVVLGALGTALFAVYLNMLDSPEYIRISSGDFSFSAHGFSNRAYPRELIIVLLALSAIQIGMAFVLLLGAITKSRKICLLWLIIAIPTVIMWNFFLRVYEIIVVYTLYQELKREQNVSDFGGGEPNSQAQSPFQTQIGLGHQHQKSDFDMNQENPPQYNNMLVKPTSPASDMADKRSYNGNGQQQFPSP